MTEGHDLWFFELQRLNAYLILPKYEVSITQSVILLQIFI